MDNVHSLLLEETRSNFYQLENLVLNLDMKAFGLAAIDALLFSMFVYLFSLFTSIPLILYVPPLILVFSLIFLILCICPQDWYRQDASATLNKYETWEPERATRQLAKNYAVSADELSQKYWEKFRFFQNGLRLAILASISEILIFLVSYH
jgi:hypothetical protein